MYKIKLPLSKSSQVQLYIFFIFLHFVIAFISLANSILLTLYR